MRFHVFFIKVSAVFFPRTLLALLFLVLAVVIGFPARSTKAYVLEGSVWPDGSQISMHLGLSHFPSSFQDGSGSWNNSASDALSVWNQYLGKVQFVPAGEISNIKGDGQNSVSFSKKVYGQNWGSQVLAITFYSYSGGVINEAEVIFNDNLKWGSYRGPLQFSAGAYTFDFHRVALHEFGHVLGLKHPDENGQPGVEAVMNSITGDLDHLADDDIAGARSLYGLRLTSPLIAVGRSGDNFGYQVTAANMPASFSASGLPPGLQINSATGLISGRPTTSGTFQVDIVVPGALGIASGRIQISISALPITSPYSPAAVLVGDSFLYKVTAENNPTSFKASGLPAGLSIDPTTGLISGIPTVAGNFSVTVTATGAASEASGPIFITIAPPTITSSFAPPVNIGSNFSFQITANNRPVSFSATGLPAGLQLDPATGLISGVPTLSGYFPVLVTAHGSGNATGQITIVVNSLTSTGTLPSATIAASNAGGFLPDRARGRLYVALPNALQVLDAKSFAIIATIPTGTTLIDLSLSPDGKRLWATQNSTAIRRIDLESLTLLPDLNTSFISQSVREGANGRLYAAAVGVLELDPTSGAILSRFTPNADGLFTSSTIEVSADGKSLYAGAGSSAPFTLAKYDISSVSGPVMLQRRQLSGSPITLKISPDGQMILHTFYSSTGMGGYVASLSSANDLAPIRDLPPGEGVNVFSPDSTQVLRTGTPSTKVNFVDVGSGAVVRTITFPNGIFTSSNPLLAVDGNNLFVKAGPLGSQATILVFPIKTVGLAPVPPHSLLNVATRLRSQTGGDVLIGGFIITGTEAKKVIVRATGPSMPVTGKLLDPVLALHAADGTLVAENDNWNAHRNDVLSSNLAPVDEHESAIVATLQPGAYTAIVRGVSGSTGVALVELYDLNPASDSHIANISTRGKVETGDNVMIGGFIIGGDQPTTVIVRALGPSLGNQGVSGTLADTTLALHDGNGAKFAENDDWQSNQAQEISSSNLAPKDPREAAIVRTLQPGNYTAIVRGKNETSGVALVEVYNLSN